jgi:hypothetical protein
VNDDMEKTIREHCPNLKGLTFHEKYQHGSIVCSMIRGCAKSTGSNKGLAKFGCFMDYQINEVFTGQGIIEIISSLAKYHSNTLDNLYIILDKGVDLSAILGTFKGLKKLSAGQLYGFEGLEWSENILEELELNLCDTRELSNIINGIHQFRKLKVLRFNIAEESYNSPIYYTEIIKELSSLGSLEMIHIRGGAYISGDPDEFVKRAFAQLLRLRTIGINALEWGRVSNGEGTITIIKREVSLIR